ncbi:hypothetical protein PAAG_01627 [Paracoccidioides lutzii Pb01]|uniref:Uncharacterized protein n=1 Tax=Paracoccidioides lutzii (strain ATCC MYA-826 / Pb01) TaxID=502779 RepID=C1GSY2_PARBA|nr:hypothetical protein PAAG_01627 [Paracoccidioides lutzii Pb01]EEH39165.1 hypothetical protein PAAG_01627 [Paracoccidioides lutzii Pb01]
MGFIKALFKASAFGGAVTTGSYLYLTRGSNVVPCSMSDYLFTSPYFSKYNPHSNPAYHDMCLKRVPLSKLNPQLLAQDGKLVEAFCASVWSGLGYAIQRFYLTRTHKGPETSHQLWSKSQLRESTYPVGTEITDHFNVVEHAPSRIILRCGDSPLKRDVRTTDGLFEVSANINQEEAVAEFGLKSLFYQGLGKTDKEPIPRPIVWLHHIYTKLLMETAVRRLTR